MAKEIRRKEDKIRKAPDDLEEKIAKLRRRTEAEKMNTMMLDLEETEAELTERMIELESVCSIKVQGVNCVVRAVAYMYVRLRKREEALSTCWRMIGAWRASESALQ